MPSLHIRTRTPPHTCTVSVTGVEPRFRVGPSPRKNQEFKIARPCSIPKKKVVGPQKTKIARPENQDFKMADPLFCPAGLWPASMLSEEKLEKGKTNKRHYGPGRAAERSEPIFLDLSFYYGFT